MNVINTIEATREDLIILGEELTASSGVRAVSAWLALCEPEVTSYDIDDEEAPYEFRSAVDSEIGYEAALEGLDPYDDIPRYVVYMRLHATYGAEWPVEALTDYLRTVKGVADAEAGAGCENMEHAMRPPLRVDPPSPKNQRFRNGKAPLTWGPDGVWCFQHQHKSYASNLPAFGLTFFEKHQAATVSLSPLLLPCPCSGLFRGLWGALASLRGIAGGCSLVWVSFLKTGLLVATNLGTVILGTKKKRVFCCVPAPRTTLTAPLTGLSANQRQQVAGLHTDCGNLPRARAWA